MASFIKDSPTEQSVKQQRALAEMLMKKGEQDDPYKTAGKYVVPVSPLNGLAKALSQVAGGYIGKQADEGEKIIKENNAKSIGSILAASGEKPLDPAFVGPPTAAQQAGGGLAGMLAQAGQETQNNPSDALTAFSQQLALKKAEGDIEASKPMTEYQREMLMMRQQDLDNKLAAGPKISVRDEMRMAKSEEAAQAATGVEQLMGEADSILKNYETSKAAPIVGKFGQFTNAIGMAGDDTKKRVTDYESLDKISKDLGIQTLKQFGGNDTDKELQVAIQTNIDPQATVETNMKTVQRKMLAANILQQKPDFESQWVARNGGLNRLDRETGKSFGSEWLRFQKAAIERAGIANAAPSSGEWKIEEVP
jgi:hypothetical protein